VNGALVRLLGNFGVRAVGLSGKDGGMARASKRLHTVQTPDGTQSEDIGFVGNIESINPEIINLLLESGYLPVIAPIAVGADGMDYNINADIFAGVIATAVNADLYISLTNVDGLYRDIKNPESRIPETNLAGIKNFIHTSASDGMLPKLESVITALEAGVRECYIFNGTKPEEIKGLINGKTESGTKIIL
jgi:acetylglutamate kinase